MESLTQAPDDDGRFGDDGGAAALATWIIDESRVGLCRFCGAGVGVDSQTGRPRLICEDVRACWARQDAEAQEMCRPVGPALQVAAEAAFAASLPPELDG